MADHSDIAALPGLQSLWAESLGDPRVCIAVLDGPVDQSHPCFNGIRLTRLKTLVADAAYDGPACRHGTHITSIIFGSHGGPIAGIAPQCHGLIIPVFADNGEHSRPSCSQLDLARAILQAVEQGAQIINISAGQLEPTGDPEPFLAQAIRSCEDNDVLIVAATGNEGCECVHVPAAIDSEAVLAVGAMDNEGNPLEGSNWGDSYKVQGVLAPGKNILGAVPGGALALMSGSSFATPIVSGVAALLLSTQLKNEDTLDPRAVRSAILKSALPCNRDRSLDCRRFLKGTLNIPGAYQLITDRGEEDISDRKLDRLEHDNVNHIYMRKTYPTVEAQLTNSGGVEMAETDNNTSLEIAETLNQPPAGPVSTPATMQVSQDAITAPSRGNVVTAPSQGIAPSSIESSEDCSCGSAGPVPLVGSAPESLVYAIGQIGYDFGTEARRDSFRQLIGVIGPDPSGRPRQPEVIADMIEYLRQRPYEATSLIWTLNLDATPAYAIIPAGPFANVAFERLREFLQDLEEQRRDLPFDIPILVSVPGVVSGSIKLMSGQIVPVLIPEVRGMYSWTIAALLRAVLGERPPETAAETIQRSYETNRRILEEYVRRIYFDIRNLGLTGAERAINYSATNVFQLFNILVVQRPRDGREEIRNIDAVRSPICRMDSECYDVRVRFFDPNNVLRASEVIIFTIDVSDPLPVSVGAARFYFEG